jgi:hypothetical protein
VLLSGAGGEESGAVPNADSYATDGFFFATGNAIAPQQTTAVIFLPASAEAVLVATNGGLLLMSPPRGLSQSLPWLE